MANKKDESVDLQALQAEIAKMMAEAKAAQAEAAKMLEEARKVTGKHTGMTAEELAAHKAEMDQPVAVKLFKDSGRYKGDVFVAVNGNPIALKRGERMEIKRKYAEVLDNSERQDYETAQMIERKTAEWAEKAAKAGL